MILILSRIHNETLAHMMIQISNLDKSHYGSYTPLEFKGTSTPSNATPSQEIAGLIKGFFRDYGG